MVCHAALRPLLMTTWLLLVPVVASGQADPIRLIEVTPVNAASESPSLALAMEGPGAVSPRLLSGMEAAFIGLQGLDVVSTLRAMNRGYRETNPLIQDVAGHPAAMLAAKAGTTAATVWLVRRLARKNRVAAFATMAAINSGYSFIVAHNLRLASQR